MKNLRWTTASPFLLASLLVSLGASAAAPERSVQVSGTCVRSVLPDRGSLLLNAEAKYADAKQAQAWSGELYERVKKRVQALGLKDLQISTQELSVEEIREWEKNRMVSKGYRGRVGMKVETSQISRLGEVSDLAAKEGIKDIGGLNQYISPKLLLDEQLACLKEASDRARAKAESLAANLGARLGEVLSIDESNGAIAPPMPRPMFKTMMMRGEEHAADESVQVDSAKQEISATVGVKFQLR